MKKILLFITVLCLLCGCSGVKTDYSELESLRISYGTSMLAGSYTMNIRKENGVYNYSYEPKPEKYGEMKCVLEENTIKEILDVLKHYKAAKWDGFDKSNKHVMDGDSFGFYADFKDATVSASGYESYPKNYIEATKEISNILSSYTQNVYEKAREDYISQDFDGEIDSFMVLYTSSDYPKDHNIQFYFYETEENKYYVGYYVDLKNDDFVEAGEYNFGGETDKENIDTEGLKRAFDECGIKYREGIETSGDNPEWYQISVSFDDGKTVETMGTTSFEGYETFRTYVLEMLKNFIETQSAE